MAALESLAEGSLGKIEIARAVGHKTVSGELKKQIHWLLDQTLIEYTLPEKPQSRLQKYRITPQSRALLKPPL